MEEEQICPFWTALVKPGETIEVHYPETYYLTVTNVCMTELPPDDKQNKPIRLLAHIQNVHSHTQNTVLLASLIPNSSEHSQINCVFTPINEVSLSVSGNAPVQVSGIINPLFIDEEEEEEEANENQNEEK